MCELAKGLAFQMEPRKIILSNSLSPGDIVMLTATVRDLHRAYPGRFLTDVRTTAMQIWENNPHITRLGEKKGAGAILFGPVVALGG